MEHGEQKWNRMNGFFKHEFGTKPFGKTHSASGMSTDSVGGHGDLKWLQSNRALIIHVVFSEAPLLCLWQVCSAWQTQNFFLPPQFSWWVDGYAHPHKSPNDKGLIQNLKLPLSEADVPRGSLVWGGSRVLGKEFWKWMVQIQPLCWPWAS